MALKQSLSKGFKGFGRFQASHGAVLTFTALLLILIIAFTVRVLPIRWEIPSGTLGLNEFDPYYQYTATNYMVQHGLFSPYYPTHWINTQQFYPQGIDMDMSLPSLPMTAAALYSIVTTLGVSIDLMSFCSLMAPILGVLAVFILYFVGKDMGGKAVGLLAALIMALSPAVIQRSSLGFFDTETVGVVSLLLFILLFLRAIDPNRSLRSMVLYSLGAAGALAYFSGGWGGAYYLIGLAAIFVFALLILKRYTQRLLFSYSITFGLGLFIATMVPFLSPSYLTTAVVLPIAGIFALLCIAEVYRAQLTARTKTMLTAGFLAVLVVAFVALVGLGDLSSIAAKFGSVLDPFARSALPIIESVAEHRITAWGSMYYELGIAVLFFLMGLYFAVKNPTNRNVFLAVFGLTTLYFAGSMVRLLVLLGPAFAILAALGVMGLLKPFLTLLRESKTKVAVKSKRGLKRIGKEYSLLAIGVVFILLVSTYAFSIPNWVQGDSQPRVYGAAYNPITISSASLPITPDEPIPEWTNMLSYTRNNLDSTTVVASWWDYGDWLGMFGNVTTLCDNTTTNTTQIENVAYAMMANETQSLKMLRNYDTEYVLVSITLQLQINRDGTLAGVSFGGYGDEGKWYWMARISGEAESRFLSDTTFGTNWMTDDYRWTNETTFGNYTLGTNWVDSNENGQADQGETFVNQMGQNATIYKLMSYAEQEWANTYGATILDENPSGAPTYFTPVYIAGLEVSPQDAATYQYQGLIPIVALYEINWDAFYAANPSLQP
ncbi:MAG: glycosyltransferase family 39 protein [Candidatus Bathyarchaeota archaeon]|nr:glycosyltransferase family 39 protein [Candidatus Bathyarchaeota archaeon]